MPVVGSSRVSRIATVVSLPLTARRYCSRSEVRDCWPADEGVYRSINLHQTHFFYRHYGCSLALMSPERLNKCGIASGIQVDIGTILPSNVGKCSHSRLSAHPHYKFGRICLVDVVGIYFVGLVGYLRRTGRVQATENAPGEAAPFGKQCGTSQPFRTSATHAVPLCSKG